MNYHKATGHHLTKLWKISIMISSNFLHLPFVGKSMVSKFRNILVKVQNINFYHQTTDSFWSWYIFQAIKHTPNNVFDRTSHFNHLIIFPCLIVQYHLFPKATFHNCIGLFLWIYMKGTVIRKMVMTITIRRMASMDSQRPHTIT